MLRASCKVRGSKRSQAEEDADKDWLMDSSGGPPGAALNYYHE